jgi:hypothetical protein
LGNKREEKIMEYANGAFTRDMAWLAAELREHPAVLFGVLVCIVLTVTIAFVGKPIVNATIAFLQKRGLMKNNDEDGKQLTETFDVTKNRKAFQRVNDRLHAIEITMQALKVQMNSLILATHRSGMQDRRKSAKERMYDAYEAIILGGNHGIDQYVIKELIFANCVDGSTEGKKMWHEVLCDMEKEGKLPTLEISRRMLKNIEQGLK